MTDGGVAGERGRWEWLGWLAAGALIALVLTWPLATHLRTVLPMDLGDPLAETWFLSWGGHATLTAPLHLFDGNAFWPSPDSYAFSDTLLGYAPAAFGVSGPVSAVTRYNLVFLFSYAVAFAAAALLARELRCRPAAAAVAGAGFAWAPWKLAHNGQLNIVSTGGVALTLFLLLSGYRRGRAWQVVAGWATAAWQISLGFALGIYFAYLLAALAAICLGYWLRAGRPPLPRPLVVATACGGSGFLVITGLMVRPYLRILARDPAATRGHAEVLFFSPPLRGLFAVHPTGRAWGSATSSIRAGLPWMGEQVLFPGVTVVLLAALGLAWRGASARLRILLAASTAVTLLLSFGLRLWGGVLYAPLLDHAPGWQGLRTPGRLVFLWSLGLALLAAMGAQFLHDALTRGRLGQRYRLASAATAAGFLLAALVTYEGAPALPTPRVPAEPRALHGLGGPQVHLPSDPFNDMAYMLWSTDGFPRIGNGSASYAAKSVQQIRADTTGFPDVSSIELLRSMGFRYVVVHRDRVPGTAWAAAADKPVTGLGISRTDDGELVVFDLNG